MRPRIERETSSVGMRPLTVSCPNPVVGAGLEPNSEERALFLKPTLSRGNASPQQYRPNGARRLPVLPSTGSHRTEERPTCVMTVVPHPGLEPGTYRL